MKCFSCNILCSVCLTGIAVFGLTRALDAVKQMGVDSVCFEASLKNVILEKCKP